MENNIKKDILQVYLPLTFPTLIICIGVKEMVYYQNFNIKIGNYLDFGELINSLFTTVNNTIGVVAFILYTVFLFGLKKKSDTSPKEITSAEQALRILDESNTKKRNAEKKLLRIGITVFIISIGMEILKFRQINPIVDDLISPLIWILYINAILLFITWGISRLTPRYKLFELDLHKYLQIIILSGLILMTMMVLGQIKAINMKYTFKEKNVDLLFKDNSSIIGSDSVYYIGNTSNYLFIYHEINDYTEVRKMEDIKVIYSK